MTRPRTARRATRPRPARPGPRAARAGARADPGAVYVDATLGMGGHAEGVLERCPECTVVGIDRDRRRSRSPASGSRRFGDRVTLVHAVYDEIRDVLADARRCRPSTASCSTSASRSLQLDEADRGFAYRVDAPLDMRMDQSTGHDRGRRAQHLRRRRPDPGPARVRRGAVRPPDRRGRRPRARAASRSPRPAGWSSCCAEPSRPPPGAAAGTRPSAPSRPCASRSTASSRCWQPRHARGDRRARRGRPDRRAVATTRSRTGSQAGPRRGAPRRAPRRACRSSCPSTPPTCACSPAAPRRPTTTRSPRTRGPRRPGSAPPSASATRRPTTSAAGPGRDPPDEPDDCHGQAAAHPPTWPRPDAVARHPDPHHAGRQRRLRGACIALLTAGLIALLLLNTALAQGSLDPR